MSMICWTLWAWASWNSARAAIGAALQPGALGEISLNQTLNPTVCVWQHYIRLPRRQRSPAGSSVSTVFLPQLTGSSVLSVCHLDEAPGLLRSVADTNRHVWTHEQAQGRDYKRNCPDSDQHTHTVTDRTLIINLSAVAFRITVICWSVLKTNLWWVLNTDYSIVGILLVEVAAYLIGKLLIPNWLDTDSEVCLESELSNLTSIAWRQHFLLPFL